ncbi:MAG: putative membrane protein [Candidatus Midichloriaceae bacterium]|jgi:putative membrane protein
MIYDFFLNNYLYIKSIHVISIICWMAGLLYLPRIFVYHTKVKKNSEACKLFAIMENKLLKIIMLPSFIIGTISGLSLIFTIGFAGNHWLHAKLLLVLCMIFIHHLMIKYAKSFNQQSNVKSEKFFRIFNEIPAVLMIFIVLLAVIKPSL